LKGTCWEQSKNGKNPPPPPLPPTKNLKEKNPRHFECMLNLPIGCMKFLFPKNFTTIFGQGKYPQYKLGVLIHLGVGN
jgi:hypothetical protein